MRDTFWDAGYRDGSFRRYWEAPVVPAELVALVERGWVETGSLALDLGCGAGLEALYLARRGVRVLGVDTSGVALALARRRQGRPGGSPVTWLKGDALALPVAAATVDLALDRGLFHLLEEPQRHRYAGEVTRILAPGGRLLLRGARHGDEEAGLFPVDRPAVETHFHPDAFELEALEAITLEAPVEDLAGSSVVVRRR